MMHTKNRWLVALVAAVAILAHFVAPGAAFASLPVLMGTATGTDSTPEIQKIIFDEPLVVNVVTDSELMGCFETDTNVMEEQTTGGRYIETAQYFAYSGGAGAVTQRGAFPQVDPPVFANGRVYLKKMGGSVEMTGDQMRKVTGDEGSYINYMERALPDLVTRLVNSIDRQYLGYGYGVKARVSAVGAYNSPAAGQFNVTVTDTLGISGWTQPWVQFLEQERNVFTGSLAGPITLRNAGTSQSALVKNIDPDTNIITFEGAQALRDALVVGDYIADGDRARDAFPQGAGLETLEISGLLAGVDDGTYVSDYMNISRTNNRLWQGQIIDGSAAPYAGVLTEKLLNYADRQARVRGAGMVDVIVTSNAGYDSYWESLKSSQMFVNPNGSFTGGRDNGLSIILGDRRVTLKIARKLPPQVTFGLMTSVWKRFSLNQWEWIDRTGSIWRGVGDSAGYYDIYAAFGVMYEELACLAPAKNWRIDNLVNAA